MALVQVKLTKGHLLSSLTLSMVLGLNTLIIVLTSLPHGVSFVNPWVANKYET